MPSTLDMAVVVMTQPGAPQLSKIPMDHPGLQVVVRGARYDSRGAHTLARSVYSTLTCLDGVTFDAGGDDEVYVIGCTATQSDPTPIGRDTNDRPEYTVNFQLTTRAPTAHRS